MLKFRYNLPKFLLMCFIFGLSIYDLFFEGSFYLSSTLSKVKNLILLVLILIVILMYFFKDKSNKNTEAEKNRKNDWYIPDGLTLALCF